MAVAEFNPSGAVNFDLSAGRVQLDKASARILVPADTLLEVCQAAGDEALRAFGRRLGAEAGRRVAERLSDAVATVTADIVVDHLGGDLALVGLGSLGLERWGAALVVTLHNGPFGPAGVDLLEAVVEGALQRVFSRDVAAIALDPSGDPLRLLVASPNTGMKVRSWLNEGVSWGDALRKLQDRTVAGAQ
jgi:hypothetical protein